MSSCMGGPSGEEEKPEDHHISAYNNCFSDVVSSGGNLQAHLLQSFEPTPEIYGGSLPSSMDMIGFPPSSSRTTTATTLHQENSSTWKGLFFNNKPATIRASAVNDPTSSVDHQLYHHDLMAGGVGADFHHHSATAGGAAAMNMVSCWNNNCGDNRSSLVMDDPSSSSSLRCVFPCEANERPSQGLSLSLSSSNPSTIGLQSFELRAQNDDALRFGHSSSSRSVSVIQNHQHHHHQSSSEFFQGQFLIRGSQYLGPVQELLNEFCSLGTKETAADKMKAQKQRSEGEDDEISGNKKDALHSSLDLMELQRRKTKLFHMLEELDRRYKHYCNQMKAVVSSFEAVAGEGSAAIYSALASKAMSRHFRCLRDGIVSQIKTTRKAMGEKDSAAPGTVRGETPRLRLLDQTLRQQKAIQQMHMMETHPWRPQRGLPERSVSVLRAWLFEHFLHPYPSDVDKHILARQTGLSRSQVSNWFINARVRLWKPMVEEMYLEELKEQEGDVGNNTHNVIASSSNHNNLDSSETNQYSPRIEDRKPSHDQLMQHHFDPGSLSSIISQNHDKNKKKIDHKRATTTSLLLDHHGNNEQEPYISFGRVGDHQSSSYGNNTMELDFSSYGGSGGGSGGVSLTLGLHHQNVAATSGGGGGHMGLAFSSSSGHQSSLFYGNPNREDDDNGAQHHVEEDCQHNVHNQYNSLLDGDHQGQTLPYRNLMGAQLLRDLAG